MAGLEDARVGCCSRSAAAAAASLRGRGREGGTAAEREGGGEAGDVKGFKLFKSPLVTRDRRRGTIFIGFCFLVAHAPPKKR